MGMMGKLRVMKVQVYSLMGVRYCEGPNIFFDGNDEKIKES